MTPVLIENGREIPIAGYQAVWIRFTGHYLTSGLLFTDVEPCGHCHPTYEEAVLCAGRLHAESQQQIRFETVSPARDPRWNNYRVEPIRELPEEHLEHLCGSLDQADADNS
jgi:hypothetical protein